MPTLDDVAGDVERRAGSARAAFLLFVGTADALRVRLEEHARRSGRAVSRRRGLTMLQRFSIGAGVAGAAGADRRRSPARSRRSRAPDGFVPVNELPPGEQLPAAPFLVGAYAFVLAADDVLPLDDLAPARQGRGGDARPRSDDRGQARRGDSRALHLHPGGPARRARDRLDSRLARGARRVRRGAEAARREAKRRRAGEAGSRASSGCSRQPAGPASRVRRERQRALGQPRRRRSSPASLRPDTSSADTARRRRASVSTMA